MSESKKESVNANNSTIHTADIKSAQDIDFLRLTTDICYVIGGFFGGKFPEGKTLIFMNDSDESVLLDQEQKCLNLKLLHLTMTMSLMFSPRKTDRNAHSERMTTHYGCQLIDISSSSALRTTGSRKILFQLLLQIDTCLGYEVIEFVNH